VWITSRISVPSNCQTAPTPRQFISWKSHRQNLNIALKSKLVILKCFRLFVTKARLWAHAHCSVFRTAKTQYQKFETNIPRKEIALPQSPFPHSCVCEQFIHSHDRSAYSAAGKYVDRSWEYINCSQTHECGN
jgi:hypothetical protein